LKKNNKGSKKRSKVVDLTKDFQVVPDIHTVRNSVKPRTDNQKDYIKLITDNTITFCQGPAGSGKTHIAIGMGLEYLLNDKTPIKKIIITRPVLEAGEKIGYLPGTAEEKLHPYLLPILDEIHHFISPAQYASLRLNNKIEVIPLGLMRGRNFHQSFIVADECQNASYDQLQMLLTRIGQDSKMVLTGDAAQSDLGKHLRGGFVDIIMALDNLQGVGISQLRTTDIVRNPIIAQILGRLSDYENRK
jgi:phosphate starvation-inducible PhoH-like protein